jgi:hypothetical protein
MAAITQTIHAQHTFTQSDRGSGTAGALAIFLTEITLGAFIAHSADSPQGKAAQNSEKGSCRANKAAVKAGDPQV